MVDYKWNILTNFLRQTPHNNASTNQIEMKYFNQFFTANSTQ